MALKIEDYGLIGNLRTAALVSRNGSVDWASAPAFDSDAFFASMVGYDQHGRWSLRPATAVRRIRQRYREDSLILETEFACYGDRCDIVRIVEAVDGEVPLEMLLNVRFGYGAYLPLIQPAPQGACFIAGPDAVTLRSDARLTLADEQACAYVTVKKGERLSFTLTWHESRLDCPAAFDATKALGD